MKKILVIIMFVCGLNLSAQNIYKKNYDKQKPPDSFSVGAVLNPASPRPDNYKFKMIKEQAELRAAQIVREAQQSTAQKNNNTDRSVQTQIPIFRNNDNDNDNKDKETEAVVTEKKPEIKQPAEKTEIKQEDKQDTIKLWEELIEKYKDKK